MGDWNSIYILYYDADYNRNNPIRDKQASWASSWIRDYYTVDDAERVAVHIVPAQLIRITIQSACFNKYKAARTRAFIQLSLDSLIISSFDVGNQTGTPLHSIHFFFFLFINVHRRHKYIQCTHSHKGAEMKRLLWACDRGEEYSIGSLWAVGGLVSSTSNRKSMKTTTMTKMSLYTGFDWIYASTAASTTICV